MTGLFGQSLGFSSKRHDWRTPIGFFRALDAEFHFTLDACDGTGANLCPILEGDALDQAWDGVVWMNPPYGRQIGRWVEKAYRESLRGATVVCLLPSRTDTGWWHDFVVRGEVRFIRGRLRFSGSGNAPFPSAVVIFRPPGERP